MKSQKIVLFTDEILPLVKNRLIKMRLLLQQKQSEVSNAPQGRLRIIKNHGTEQYYHITEKGNRNGKYIPKENIQLVKSLLQHEYNKKLIAELATQIESMETFCSSYNLHKLQNLYEHIPQKRKKLIQPAYLTMEEYAKAWQTVTYNSLPFDEAIPEHYVSNGQRVRSKSEILIAETLIRENIPFRYEYPVKLKLYTATANVEGLGNIIHVHPDFYCLNTRTGKEYIWEHFGMMDDADYASKAIAKLNNYALNGWHYGQNLIATFETHQMTLNSKVVRSFIDVYLK